MKKMVSDGVIPSLHRSRNEILLSKSKKKGIQASTWYLKDKTSRTIKCHPTPGGLLAKKINMALNPIGSIE